MALTQVNSGGIADGAVTTNDLENSGVTAGTYGSSSAIPAITVDAKGRITSASTNSITQIGGANGVDFNDSVQAVFGADSDLQISHNNTNSVISHNGTGDLYVQTTGASEDLYLRGQNDVYIRPNGGSAGITAAAGGAVTLFHNANEKLATTSSGINVTGTVTCDGLQCDGAAQINASTGYLYVIDSDHDGVAAQNAVFGRDYNGNNDWYIGQISSSNNNIRFFNDNNANIEFGTNAGVKAVLQNDGHFRPDANNQFDLGTSSYRWRNVYTNDLNLSNEGGTNDVDGTWGSWTIQEGEDDLFLLNRRNGKKYKFNLTEVS